MSELANPEIRLVEQYVGVLDYLSRCAQAIDTDDWWYLLAKTAELERRVAWLHEGRRRAVAGHRPGPSASPGNHRGGGRGPGPPLPSRPAAAPHRAPGAAVIAPPAPRRPAPGGGLAVLVVVTLLAALAAPHARPLADQAAAGLQALPGLRLPALPAPPPVRAARPSRAGRPGRRLRPRPAGQAVPVGGRGRRPRSTARG